MKTKINFSGFKANDETMTFECYGNVKGNIDHAYDRTMDGAYTKSIETHKKNGTMPLMLWSHDSWSAPIGKWTDAVEDSKGLLLKGQFANTERGREVYELMKMGALDSFSIGYSVVSERWNDEKGCNDLIELDLKEISPVNFACNEESRLVSIKSKLNDNELPSKRELEKFLHEQGLSKKQSMMIVSKYKPDAEDKPLNALEELVKLY